MSTPVNCLSVPLLLFLPLHHPWKTMAPTHPFTCPPSKTFAIISHQQIQLDEPCSFGGWGTDISILSGLFVSSWKLFQSSLSTDRQVTNGYVMFLVGRNTVSVLSGLSFPRCLLSLWGWKIEAVHPFGAQDRFVCYLDDNVSLQGKVCTDFLESFTAF